MTHSPDEKHLKIENVTLKDDGLFECQMIHPSLGAYRTSASVTVLGKIITSFISTIFQTLVGSDQVLLKVRFIEYYKGPSSKYSTCQCDTTIHGIFDHLKDSGKGVIRVDLST